MNKLHDQSIRLNPENHTYILKDDPDFKFTSSTQFIHRFFEPFDKEAVAKKLLNIPKYAGYTKEDLFNEWSQAAAIGTKVHKELEDYVSVSARPTQPKGISGVKWLVDTIPSTCTLYPEVIVYSKKLKIAGMIDLLIHNTLDDTYSIVDWKTNKQIRERSYKGKTGTQAATADVEDCNLNQYSLQLSLYRYILEEAYDLKIKKLSLVHLKDEGACLYDCLYMKRTLKDMLDS